MSIFGDIYLSIYILGNYSTENVFLGSKMLNIQDIQGDFTPWNFSPGCCPWTPPYFYLLSIGKLDYFVYFVFNIGLKYFVMIIM